ncbi:MAG: glycosyltransferase [Streptosporangiales bacterium]|nr:glycosyltransferase [Streptosporangiales bacterium]MBO0889443.1 glycosyltransferase [Acidothermales bacterium]
MPEVTVVVIVYDDADRLPTAMRSVLRQTLQDIELVVVDDASTDGSARAARRIAAQHPGRVRVISLDTNSGGCSRPRNVGMAHARGDHVMFLDSDDTIEPDACRLLLERARATGADFVSGRCVRVHFDDNGRESVWCPKLFEGPAVYGSVRENPDLLNDTLSTNKLYRRDFLERAGLRFPEGVHYEDILFSAQAYIAAKRIATIPDRVYNWRFFRRMGRRSITSSRADLQNFADRIEVHRRVDALLLDRGDTDLRLHKDVKFINHDLQLYVSDLRTRGAEYRRQFLAVAGTYLAELDPAAFEECKPLHGILAYFLLLGDAEHAIGASDFAGRKGRRGRLLTDLVERDGRVYWCADQLDTELGRAQLDVTELEFPEVSLADVELGNEVRYMAVTGSRLRLDGELVNPLGRIPAAPAPTAELELYDLRHPRRRVRVPAEVVYGRTRIAWQVDLDVARTVRPFGVVDPQWVPRLVLHAGDETYVSRLTADRAYAGAELPVRPRLGRGVGDHLETRLADGGVLRLHVVARGVVSRATVGAARRIVSTRTGRRALHAVIGVERRMLAKLRPPPTPVSVPAPAEGPVPEVVGATPDTDG